MATTKNCGYRRVFVLNNHNADPINIALTGLFYHQEAEFSQTLGEEDMT